MKEIMLGITILLAVIAYNGALISITLIFHSDNKEDGIYGRAAIIFLLISAYLTLISIVLS